MVRLRLRLAMERRVVAKLLDCGVKHRFGFGSVARANAAVRVKAKAVSPLRCATALQKTWRVAMACCV